MESGYQMSRAETLRGIDEVLEKHKIFAPANIKQLLESSLYWLKQDGNEMANVNGSFTPIPVVTKGTDSHKYEICGFCGYPLREHRASCPKCNRRFE